MTFIEGFKKEDVSAASESSSQATTQTTTQNNTAKADNHRRSTSDYNKIVNKSQEKMETKWKREAVANNAAGHVLGASDNGYDKITVTPEKTDDKKATSHYTPIDYKAPAENKYLTEATKGTTADDGINIHHKDNKTYLDAVNKSMEKNADAIKEYKEQRQAEAEKRQRDQDYANTQAVNQYLKTGVYENWMNLPANVDYQALRTYLQDEYWHKGKAMGVKFENGELKYTNEAGIGAGWYVPTDENNAADVESARKANWDNMQFISDEIMNTMYADGFDWTNKNQLKYWEQWVSIFSRNDEENRETWDAILADITKALRWNEERDGLTDIVTRLQDIDINSDEHKALLNRLAWMKANFGGDKGLGYDYDAYISDANAAVKNAYRAAIAEASQEVEKKRAEYNVALRNKENYESAIGNDTDGSMAEGYKQAKEEVKLKEQELADAEAARDKLVDKYWDEYATPEEKQAKANLVAGKPSEMQHDVVGKSYGDYADIITNSKDQQLVDAANERLGLDQQFYTWQARAAATAESSGYGIQSSIVGAGRAALEGLQELNAYATNKAEEERVALGYGATGEHITTEAERQEYQNEQAIKEMYDHRFGAGSYEAARGKTTLEVRGHKQELADARARLEELQTREEEIADSAGTFEEIPGTLQRELNENRSEQRKLKKQIREWEKDAKEAGAMERPVIKLMTDLTEELSDKEQKLFEKALTGAGKVEQFLYKGEKTIIEVGFDTFVGSLTGTGALVPMAIRVFGRGAEDARKAGATIKEQALYGAATAGIEVFTEILLGGFDKFGYGKGWLSESIVSDAISHMATTDWGLICLNALASFVEEGGEEVLSDLLAPLADMIYQDKSFAELFKEETANVLEDFLLGGALGFLGFATESSMKATNAVLNGADPLYGINADTYAKDAEALGKEFERNYLSSPAGRIASYTETGKAPEIKPMTKAEESALEDAKRRQEYQKRRKQKIEERIREAETGIKGVKAAAPGKAGEDSDDVNLITKTTARIMDRVEKILGRAGEVGVGGVNHKTMSDAEGKVGLPVEEQKTGIPAGAPQSSAEYTARVKADAKEVTDKIKAAVGAKKISTARLAEVNSTEFGKSEKKLTETISKFFHDLGNKVKSVALGSKEVIIDEASIQRDIAHGIGSAKACTLKTVPAILAKGEVIDEQKNWKGRGYDTKIIAGAVSIDGKPTYVGCVVVGVQENGETKFYLHEIIDGNGQLIYNFDGMPTAPTVKVTPKTAAPKAKKNSGAAAKAETAKQEEDAFKPETREEIEAQYKHGLSFDEYVDKLVSNGHITEEEAAQKRAERKSAEQNKGRKKESPKEIAKRKLAGLRAKMGDNDGLYVPSTYKKPIAEIYKEQLEQEKRNGRHSRDYQFERYLDEDGKELTLQEAAEAEQNGEKVQRVRIITRYTLDEMEKATPEKPYIVFKDNPRGGLVTLFRFDGTNLLVVHGYKPVGTDSKGNLKAGKLIIKDAKLLPAANFQQAAVYLDQSIDLTTKDGIPLYQQINSMNWDDSVAKNARMNAVVGAKKTTAYEIIDAANAWLENHQNAPKTTGDLGSAEIAGEATEEVKPTENEVKLAAPQQQNGITGENEGEIANGEALGNASEANGGDVGGVHESEDVSEGNGGNPQTRRRSDNALSEKAAKVYEGAVKLIRSIHSNVKAISYSKYGKALKTLEDWAGERVNLFLADQNGGICSTRDGGKEAGLFAVHSRTDGHGANGVVHEKTHRNLAKYKEAGNSDPCGEIYDNLWMNNIVSVEKLDSAFNEMLVGWGQQYLQKVFSEERFKEYDKLNTIEERAEYIQNHLNAINRVGVYNLIYNEMICELAANVPGWFHGFTDAEFNAAVKYARNQLVNLGVYEKGAFDHIDTIVKNANARLNALAEKDTANAERFRKYIRPIEDFDGSEGMYLFEVPAPDNPSKKSLLAVRNMSLKTAWALLRHGGEAMPSVAIINFAKDHSGFGEISAILKPEAINPDVDRANRVYNEDAWTPTHPKTVKNYKDIKNALENISSDIYEISGIHDTHFLDVLKDPSDFAGFLEDGSFLTSDYFRQMAKLAIAKEAGYSKADLAGDKEIPSAPELLTELSFDDEFYSLDFAPYEVEEGRFTTKTFRFYLSDYIQNWEENFYYPENKEAIINGAKKYIKENKDAIKKSFEKIRSLSFADKSYDADEFETYCKDLLACVEFVIDKDGFQAALQEKADELIPNGVVVPWLEHKTGLNNAENKEELIEDPNTGELKPYSLETALEIMRRKPEVNTDGTRRFKSMAEIKSHERNLKSKHVHGHSNAVQHAMERAETVTENAFQDVIQSKHVSPYWKGTDRAETLKEAIDAGEMPWISVLSNISRTIDAQNVGYDFLGIIKRELNFWGVDPESAAGISAINAINDYFDLKYSPPTGYFESKPNRVVSIDEYAGFVVPMGKEYDKFARAAIDAGLLVSRSQAADDFLKDDVTTKPRQKVIVDDFIDYAFQMPSPDKQTESAQPELAEREQALQQENEELKRQLEELKTQQEQQRQEELEPEEPHINAENVPGKLTDHQTGLEDQMYNRGERIEHETRMDDIAEKFGTDDGMFFSKTREQVSRIARYCIDKYGLKNEYDRLLNKRDWDRLDYSIVGKILYEMSTKLHRDMTSKRGLGPVLERKAGESWTEFHRRQAESDKRAYRARRQEIDALMQIYNENKSVLGQELQEKYKFSVADEIRMRASQRFLGYTIDGEVGSAEFPKRLNVRMWRVIDDLLTEVESYETRLNENPTAEDMEGLKECVKKINYIRGRQNMFGKLGVKGESWLFNHIMKNGVDAEALTKLAYGSVNKIMDDLMVMSWADAVHTIRVSNMLSNVATAINNLANNAVSLRTGALAQNIGMIPARAFEKATGKKVGFKDTGLLRTKPIRRAEALAFEYSLLSSYYGLMLDEGRLDTKGHTGNFDVNGSIGERLLAQYNFLVSAAALNPDAPAKARARAGMKAGLDEAFAGVDMTKHENYQNRMELEGYIEQTAQHRTLQDNNAVSNAVMYIKSQLNKVQTPGGKKVVYGRELGSLKLGDFMMAFAKVPTNVVQQKVMATPYGALYQVGKYAMDVARVKADPNSMTSAQMAKSSRNVGRAAVTSGMVVLGALAAMTGALKNFDNGDDEEKKLAAEKGYRGLMFNVDALFRIGDSSWHDGDHIISGTFLEVLSMPLAIGGLIWDDYVDSGKESLWSSVWTGTKQSFTQILDSLSDIPGLQQVGDLYQSYMYADVREGDNDFDKMLKAVGQFAASSSTSYFMPNIASQAAAGFDNTVRDTYRTDSYAETLRNLVLVKIPGARSRLIPAKTDAFGNVRRYGGNKATAMLNTVVLPGDVYVYHENEVEREFKRLREAGYDSTWFDTSEPKKITADDQDFNLTADASRAYHNTKAGHLMEAYQTFLNSEYYKGLSDDERIAVYKQLRTDATRQTTQETLKVISPGTKVKMDKWETDLKTLDERVQYLSAKTRIDSFWDSDNNVFKDYDAAEAFFKKTYPKLNSIQRKLIDNSDSWADKAYSAITSAHYTAKEFEKVHKIRSEYDAMEGNPTAERVADMNVKQWEAVGKDDKKAQWAYENETLSSGFSMKADHYDALTNSGIRPDVARDLSVDIQNIEPAKGYKQVQDSQEILKIIEKRNSNLITDDEAYAAFAEYYPNGDKYKKKKDGVLSCKGKMSFAAAVHKYGLDRVRTK